MEKQRNLEKKPSRPEKTPRRKPAKIFRMKGATLLGKYTLLYATEEGVEIATISNLFMLIWLSVFALGVMTPTVLLSNILISLIVFLSALALGYLLLVNIYPGKVYRDFYYSEIVSFVLGNAEFTINTTDDKIYMLKLKPEKQQQFVLAVADLLPSRDEYYMEANTPYFRIKRKNREKLDPGDK